MSVFLLHFVPVSVDKGPALAAHSVMSCDFVKATSAIECQSMDLIHVVGAVLP
jgi:hypothetical protein